MIDYANTDQIHMARRKTVRKCDRKEGSGNERVRGMTRDLSDADFAFLRISKHESHEHDKVEIRTC